MIGRLDRRGYLDPDNLTRSGRRRGDRRAEGGRAEPGAGRAAVKQEEHQQRREPASETQDAGHHFAPFTTNEAEIGADAGRKHSVALQVWYRSCPLITALPGRTSFASVTTGTPRVIVPL